MHSYGIEQAVKSASNVSPNQVLTSLSSELLSEALLIRAVESSLLNAFQNGRVAGTIHTSIGQELSAVIIGSNLISSDFVTSNHRCHGHFISVTKNWKGLVLEILGSREGVCRGVGSSQHLKAEGFLSNGPQASLLPIGTGVAFQKKIDSPGSISVSFIGEGTFGEGLTYESLNLAAVFGVPQLFVCENNFYSQSTKQEDAVSGTIIERAKSFGIKTFECNIWDQSEMADTVSRAVRFVRENQSPAFLIIYCYRLMAHSKGDDDRDKSEINFFSERDPLNLLMKFNSEVESKYMDILTEVKNFIDSQNNIESLLLSDYEGDQLPRESKEEVDLVANPKIRVIESIRTSIENSLRKGALVIGEDLKDPYGGAFKVTKGLSTKYPNQVLNTPISEAALVGFAIGTAMTGRNTIVEIMFGDFVTYAFDQILSNASKFYHVYNNIQGLPLIIRLPNGGHRGYGPTHSQSLEKHLVGIDNVLVIANTSLLDTVKIMELIFQFKCPTLLIENKMGYSKLLFQQHQNLTITHEDQALGNIRIRTSTLKPEVSIIAYGELARLIADNLLYLEKRFNFSIELICLIQLHPIRSDWIISGLLGERVIVMEEGSKDFGIGAEIAGKMLENNIKLKSFVRLGAKAVPIASNVTLENEILVNLADVEKTLESWN